MSATKSPRETRKKVTAQEYRAMPEPGPRYQLIEGVLHEMSPAPTSRHQRVARRIFVPLHLFVEAKRLGEVFFAPIDVYLSDETVFQPDVAFVATASTAKVVHEGIQGPPDLVVEVLSPSTRRIDLQKKDALYAKHGVREAWYADLDIDEIRIHRFEAGATAATILLRRGGVIEMPLLPGFALPVDDALGPAETE